MPDRKAFAALGCLIMLISFFALQQMVRWGSFLLFGSGSSVPARALSTPETTTKVTTTTTTVKHFFTDSDCERYRRWPWKKDDTCKNMPKILLFTWCTESTYESYRNEMYWKSCYAHMHGYDLIIADPFNTKEGSDWYTNFNLWAWWVALKDQVPKYDYVFTTGADVLLTQNWLEFPVWAFDAGNKDLNLMDQCYSDWGFNENAFLFKYTNWSMDFLNQGLIFKEKSIIQGDNGGWMENILISLGQEVAEKGGKGYSNKCLPHLMLSEPLEKVLKRKDKLYAQKNLDYSKCFFSELSRMAGPYNMRLSKHIGFNPLMDVSDKTMESRVPWANCWSHLHDPFFSKTCVGDLDPKVHCFAFHWNGLSKLLENHKIIHGSCPDPTFNWDASPYNTKNRRKKKSLRL